MGDEPALRANRPGLAACRDHPLRMMGFRLALLTTLTVVAYFFFDASTGWWSHVAWPVALWAVAYAVGLVIGWRSMQPLAAKRRLFAVGASGLLVQGVAYLLLWLLLLGLQLAEYAHFDSSWSFATDFGGGVFYAASTLLLAGPLLAVLPMVSARGAGRMLVAQLFGPIGFFCMLAFP